MITEPLLRDALKQILGIDDKHLVPISQDWFIPTIDPDDHVGSWVGYRILSKQPTIRASQSGPIVATSAKIRFRITFVGPQAEQLADQTLLWNDRTDVTKVFEETMDAQICYTDRVSFTYPIRNGGFNDELCWVVDLTAQSFYSIDTKQVPWITRD